MVRKLDVTTIDDIKDPILRKYTLTHSDETGQRYLHIGKTYAEEEYGKLNDQILAKWYFPDDNIPFEKSFIIACFLDCENSSLSLDDRYSKFVEHMPRAISAIINGDQEFIIKNKLLESVVSVYFISDNCENKIEAYGKVKDFII